VRLPVASLQEGRDRLVVEDRRGGAGGHATSPSSSRRWTAPSGIGSQVGRLRAS
jgi:hypothetical protein